MPKLDLRKEDPYQVGVCFGTSVGPIDIYERFGASFYERGLKRVHPIFEGLDEPQCHSWGGGDGLRHSWV